MQKTPSLPLGAVRADDGSVVVPESRRADGSVRKPIRIRQGYVPQDEVPKYKPVGQRMREQQRGSTAEDRGSVAKGPGSGTAVAKERGSASSVAEDLSALSLQEKKPAGVEKRERVARPQERRPAPPLATSPPSSPVASSSTKELKSELSTINKSLREIAKLEAFDAAFARGDDGSRPLTAPQKRKVERKAQLETRRRAIIAVLDGEKSTKGGEGAQEEVEEDVKPKTLRVIEL